MSISPNFQPIYSKIKIRLHKEALIATSEKDNSDMESEGYEHNQFLKLAHLL